MKTAFLSFFMMCIAIASGFAQTPDIRIKTSIYEKDGATNAFTIILGAAPGHTGYADVKCSGGNQSEAEIVTAEYDQETGGLKATYVSCQVNEEGVVEIFLDEGVVVDYFSCTGAEITSIEFKNPEAIEILALEHNILESLDLTPFSSLQALYLNDNPMSKSPLTDKGSKPELTILEICQIENIDPEFDIVSYPKLVTFDAMSTHGLLRLTPSACPGLKKISIDNTSVSEIDLSQNPELIILNISESRIKNIDLSKNTKLQQFFATHSSAFNTDIKMNEIDVTNNPDLIYLFLNDNQLTNLDVSKCPLLQDLYVRNNRLSSLDLSQNPNLINVFITDNDMDFNSLPLPTETWADYDLTQRPFAVPSAVLVGNPIDLSKQVVRNGSDTYAMLYITNEEDPLAMTELDTSLYSFENGILTVNEIFSDSIFASFYNSAFPDTELSTRRFVVKDKSSFSKPNLMASISTDLPEGTELKMSIGLANAKVGNQRKFFADLGDGNLQEFTALTSGIPSEPNLVAIKTGNGPINIYMPEGETLTALKIEDMKLTGLDLSNAVQIELLTLTNTGLKTLDLKWNRLLKEIDITGNDFGSDFSLAGVNGGYGKNILYHINLSNNNMTEVKLNEPGSWKYIDLSHNHLTNVNFTDADYVEYLDVSHNDFEYLKINYLGMLKTFFCNDCRLSELVLPETNVIEMFNCANNRFTFANMPDRNGLDEEHFIYAPQAVIEIPTKGPGYNLSSQNVTINGKNTVFSWKTIDGETLVNGEDFTCVDGVTRFNDNTIGKTLYCELTNAAFPAMRGDNVLKTTPMLSAGMPTHLLGSFTTTNEGQEVRLSLTSAVPNNSVYIDWTGTNSLEQYPLATSYTVFTAKTTAGAKVKVWSYEENDNLTVFSLSNAKLSDVDLSPMKNLICLTLSYTGISDLRWPESPDLRELSLDGCNFSSFDFSRYPNLNFANFDYNKFKSVDLSGLDKLGTAAFAHNGLKEIKLSGNTSLWQLGLSVNQIENINLNGAPNLEQLFLDGNRLSNIDLSMLNQLRVVYLDNNKFDFSNLPIPQNNWALYTYGNQPELKISGENGIVDLSSQAVRDTVQTSFNWFYGRPSIDMTEGTISGEELIEGEEFIIENGVTTFLEDIDQVCCVLLNDLFPKTYLITNVVAVSGTSGIQSVKSDNSEINIEISGRTVNIVGANDGALFSIFSIDGQLIAQAVSRGKTASIILPSPGLYLISSQNEKGNFARKVIVK